MTEVEELRAENVRLIHERDVARGMAGAVRDGSADWQARAEAAEAANTRLEEWRGRVVPILERARVALVEGTALLQDNCTDDDCMAAADLGVEARQEIDALLAAPASDKRSIRQSLKHAGGCGYLAADPMTGDEAALCSCGAVDAAFAQHQSAPSSPK